MKKLVFVSFAMSVFGGISGNAYGMFNARDELQNAGNHTSLTHTRLPALPADEETEMNQSEIHNNQIGDLATQVSRLTTLVETSLANTELFERIRAEELAKKENERDHSSVYNYQIGDLGTRVSQLSTLVKTSLANAELSERMREEERVKKENEKDHSSVYNYQIGDLGARISRLTTLVETSLANEKRKNEENNNSSVYNYQIGDLGTRISQLTTLVENLNEKVTTLSREAEPWRSKNDVKFQESAERKEEAKSTEININSADQYNAKSIIESKLTELLKVKNEDAINKRMEEFSALVEGVYGERKSEWIGSTDIKIENNAVKFVDPTARAYGLSIDRIKKFLENIQEEIEQYKIQHNNKQRVLEELQSRDSSVSSSTNRLSLRRGFVSKPVQESEAPAVVGSLDVKNAKSVTEETFTELLKVAEEKAVKEKIQEFYDLIAGDVVKPQEGTERNEGAEKAQAPSNKGSVKANLSSTDLINSKNDLTTSKGSIFKGKQTYASPSSSVEGLSYYDNNGSNSNLFGMSSANSVSDEGYQEYMRERESIEAGDNSNASAVIDINSVKLNAKGAIEEMLTELLNVTDQGTVEKAIEKFNTDVVKKKLAWVGNSDIKIENNKVKFADRSTAYLAGFFTIKAFLEEIQEQINQQKEQLRHKQVDEPNVDKLAVNEEKANSSSNARAAVDIDSVTKQNARKAVEDTFTDLLNAKGEDAVNKRVSEFSNLVQGKRGGPKAAWLGRTDIKIENGRVEFADSSTRANGFDMERIKKFLREVYEEIDQYAKNEEKANSSSNARAAVDIDSVNVDNAKGVIEEMLTELLKVTDQGTVEKAIEKFNTDVVKSAGKHAWISIPNIIIENKEVKFNDRSRAYPAGFFKIKAFLEEIQEQINQQKELLRQKHTEEPNVDKKLAVNEEKANSSSNARAAVDIDSVTAQSARKAVEDTFTDLLNAKGEDAVTKRANEFSSLVKGERGVRKAAWLGRTDIKIENGVVEFVNPGSRANGFDMERIKKFLREVYEEIDQYAESDVRHMMNNSVTSTLN